MLNGLNRIIILTANEYGKILWQKITRNYTRGTGSTGLTTQIIDRLSLLNKHEHHQNLGTHVSNYSREKQHNKKNKKAINNL